MRFNLYTQELRRAREAAGLSQEELAQKAHYSVSLVSQVESGQRNPTRDFTEAAEEVLGTAGLLTRIREYALREQAVLDGLQPWVTIQEQATTLRAYNPLVVYGLLQTEAYARSHLRTEGLVAARMQRQRDVFEQDRPPTVTVLLDESVLYRELGGAEVTRAQLAHLAHPDCPATVRVVPLDADTTEGWDGAFDLATIDGREVAYAETPWRGFVLDNAEVVAQAREGWEALTAEALPLKRSRDLILKAMEERWSDS